MDRSTTPSAADGAVFPHPASVGSVDHCGLCGRHIPPDEQSRTTVFGKPGSEDVVTQVCRDHLVPSARQRKNLEIVAGANAAQPGLIHVIPDSPAEQRHYNEALTGAQWRIAAERARQPRAAVVPRRVNGSSGRPGRRAGSSSRTAGNDPGADDPGLSPVVWTYGFLTADDDPAWVPCPHCGQPLVEETDGTHCGGCAITWWEGMR